MVVSRFVSYATRFVFYGILMGMGLAHFLRPLSGGEAIVGGALLLTCLVLYYIEHFRRDAADDAR